MTVIFDEHSNSGNMQKNDYTDLSEEEWLIISPLFSGHKIKHSKKEMINAIFYILRVGCSWRFLPNDFPPLQISTAILETGKISAYGKKSKTINTLRKLANLICL